MMQNITKLYIGNLSFDATEEDIKQLFKTYGEVSDVKIVTDRYTGRPRGFAFVEMATTDGANHAKKSLDGQQFHGRDLSVDLARARPPTSRGNEEGFESRSPRHENNRSRERR